MFDVASPEDDEDDKDDEEVQMQSPEQEMHAPTEYDEDEDEDAYPLSPLPSDAVGFGADGQREGSTTPIERHSEGHDDSGRSGGGGEAVGTPPALDPALLFGVSSRISGRSGRRNRDRRSRLEAEERLRIEVRRLSGVL